MRPAMIATVLVLSATLPACGGDGGEPGPERRSAAGQILGGEASDAMVALDTVQSTSPADPRAGQTGDTPQRDTRGAPTPAVIPPDQPKVVDGTPIPQPSETLPAGPPTED